MAVMTGKRALVLGGSRGIGRAIVERLSADGAEVVFSYAGSTEAANALALATGASAMQADSADRDAVDALIKAIGALDVLVVNAGIGIFGDPLLLDASEVDRMFDVNIRGPYHAIVAGGRTMNDNGRIIVIGSVNGDRMPIGEGTAYATTKSAIQGMVRGFARAFGPRGITVNNVQPGPVDTDLNPSDGPMAAMLHAGMAIKRHARPHEIASMVAYLLSPDAAMVTGAQHNIDGGYGA